MLKKINYFHYIYIAIITILATTVVVLAININNEREMTPHQQYYQNKCNSYLVQNTNLSKGQIVFIGDSITDLYPLDNYYVDLDLATYNRGIGGDTTSGVLNRLEVSLFDIKPSKIVLMIGTNDINGNVQTPKILANYNEILTKIKRELPDTQIYCVSIIPQNLALETYSNIKVEETTKTILEINAQLKQMTENEANVTYIDLFPLLADDNNMLIEEYSDDGLHLNAAGFEVWTNLLKPYLIG
jgi:lysophospholipase L1-like esterase